MTLILGINTSDNIYFSSDTRITDDVSGELLSDVIQKFEIISNSVVIAVAGNLKLAQFLVSEFKKEHISKRDINYIYKKIEKWIKLKVGKFIENNNKKEYKACIMFGGLSLNHVTNFSRVFAVLVNTNPRNAYVNIEMAENGEYLLYGHNLTKDKLELLEKEKLEEISKTEQSFDTYRTLLTGITKGIAEKRNIQSIGGSVIPIGIERRGIKIMQGGVFSVKVEDWGIDDKSLELLTELKVVNGKLFCKDVSNGEFRPVISFLEFGEKYFVGELSL